VLLQHQQFQSGAPAASPNQGVGLHAHGMRLGSSRGAREKGVAHSARNVQVRLEDASIGHGMSWPDDVLTAVAQAASVQQKPAVLARPAPPASSRPHVSHGERDRDREGRQWLGAVPGGAWVEVDHVAPETPVGITSAPVVSPRQLKPGAGGGRAAIGYTGRDALVPQANLGVKQIGLCLPQRPSERRRPASHA
jgi:hypothetical protein